MSSVPDMAAVDLPRQLGGSQVTGRLTPIGDIDERCSGSSIESVTAWAQSTRSNIDSCIQSGLPVKSEHIDDLCEQLSTAVIGVLQKKSTESWQYLRGILKIILPYSSLLSDSSQLHHYAQRIIHRVTELNNQELAAEILELIRNIFPQTEMSRRMAHTSRDATPLSTTTTHHAAEGAETFILPDGSDPYRPLIRTGDAPMKPPGISFGDLADVMPSVIHETVQHDAVWSEGLGLTAAALSTKLPHTKSENAVEAAPRRPDSSWGLETSVITPRKPRAKISLPKVAEVTTPRSGKEIVELFGKGRHLGEAQFVYLNKAAKRHFRPYDLIEVPQHKADPEEHWMVSCFGILHKVRGQPAESVTLYEWHREAVLWSALMRIPFFKNFLVMRAFKRWRQNQRSIVFSYTRHRIGCNLLQAKPRFGTAILQISKLLQELQLLTLLPRKTSNCFTLSEFDFVVLKKYREGKLILDKFFRFCRMILDKTCMDSVERLRFCEAQTKQDRAVFSTESLYVQRQKKDHREQNLAIAHDETSCLGNFVLLVDQLLVSHLLALTRANICTFIEESMAAAGARGQQEASFTAKLIFTDQHTLTLFPSKEKFCASLKQTVDSIPALISESAGPVSELTSGLISSIEESGGNIPRGTGTTPDPAHIGVHLEEPDIQDTDQPRKSEDDLGVATPPTCVPGLNFADLAVIGQGVVGQCNPLTQDGLFMCLSQDERVMSSRQMQSSLMDSALADIDAFIEEHAWLSEIHQFTTTWTRDSAEEWRRAQAYTIEAKLGEIRDWAERVSSVVRMFITNNAMFLVDCESIQTDLVPRLDAAFNDLLDSTATNAMAFAAAFTEEIRGVVSGMKEKNSTIAAFAEYAQQYNTYKDKMAALQSEVEYIKSLFEVIRLSCRTLHPEEEKHEEQVWQSWEAFLLQLQDAAEFVHVQMPIKTEELDAAFKRHMAEACQIHKEATRGVYLDPTQDSTTLLSSLGVHFDAFYKAQSEIHRCSIHREKMLGKPFDVTELSEMLSAMRERAELWKYLESSASAIEDWKLTVFRKFDVQKAIDKITEWQRAASSLKQHLPQSDRVLAQWYKMLCSFKQDLPLLLKLHSSSLRHRHWRAIFLAIGETYNESKSHRVVDLLSYKIAENSQAIINICAGAEAEYTLEKSLVKLRQVWEEKDLKIAKHITKGTEAITSESHQDVFTLIGVEELKYLLEDSQVSLQNMLVSPHLADLRPDTELWRSTLSQVNEIVDLISECQTKWLFLYSVFKDAGDVHYPKLILKYDAINRIFQEVMVAITADPKVLSLVDKKRGVNGWRELQGGRLRALLLDLIKRQEELCKDVNEVLTKARLAYPRFFFLCDNDLTALLAQQTDRCLWVPYVRKLFPAIKDVTLAMSSDPHGIQRHLDMQLHADKLEAVSFDGHVNDHVTLIQPVTPSRSIGAWWTQFEHSVKSTMGSMLNACLESRLQGGDANPQEMLQELAGFKRSVEDESTEGSNLEQAVEKSFTHWLLRFPIQCSLVANAVLWSRQVDRTLQDNNTDTLTTLLGDLDSSINQYTSILRSNSDVASQGRARIYISNMIIQALHHRDILRELLKLREVTVDSFDWQKVIKYSVDISKVVCLGSPIQDDHKPTLSSQYVFSPCRVEQLGSSHSYNYEYVGPSLRLVATPLTDRCHLAMITAMRQFECGTITGPPSVGKEESLGELAKIMGAHFFTVDCLNVTDIGVLTNVLHGMVQSGCWGLFDNVYAMNQDLMCVFAQSLQHIFHAYRTLDSERHQHYDVEVKTDKKLNRRHSLTTLLPTDGDGENAARTWKGHTSKQEGRPRKRRHSIDRGHNLSMSEHNQGTKEQVPLFRPKSANDSPTPPMRNWVYKPHTSGHLEFTGHLIPASEHFACFISITMNGHGNYSIPSTLRAVMRPTSMVVPDVPVILETRLICSGFQESQRLGRKLHSLSQTLEAQFPDQHEIHLDLRVLRSVIDAAALRLRYRRNLHQLTGTSHSVAASGLVSEPDGDLRDILEEDDLHKEENALLSALSQHLQPRLSDTDQQRQVQDLLRCIFPWGGGRPPGGDSGHDPVLLDAIQAQFVTDKLQATPHHVRKVIELYQSLQNKRGTILVGPPGSGKSVCYQTLACVLNNLHRTSPSEKDGQSSVPHTTEAKSSDAPSTSSLHRVKLKAEVISRVSLHWIDSVTKRQQPLTYPAVDISVIYPAALTEQEIIGEWNADHRSWRDGLLTKLIRESAVSATAARNLADVSDLGKTKQKKQCGGGLMGTPSIIDRWVVMDGDMNETLSEMLYPLTGTNARCSLNLASIEHLDIPGSLSLIIETTDISQMSPAMVAQCSVLHFGEEVVQWRLLLDSWLSGVKTKWDCSSTNFLLLTSLISETFQGTIDFLGQSGCSFILDADQLAPKPLLPGLREIAGFTQIMGALLGLYFKRDDDVGRDDRSTDNKVCVSIPPRPTVLLSSMFVYAYIWGFGGGLHERYWDQFEVFTRQTLSRCSLDIHIPTEGSLFIYHINPSQGMLVPLDNRSKTLSSGYTVIPQMGRYAHLIDLLLPHTPLLIAGAPGVGKSALVQNVVHPKHPYSKMTFSPTFTREMFEESLLSKLQPVSMALNPSLAQKGGTRNKPMLFMDDLNCCANDTQTSGYPNLAVLRQLLSRGGFYKSLVFQALEPFSFLGACTPTSEPGAGSAPLSPRLTRLMTVLTLTSPSRGSILAMYGQNLTSWLEEFPAYSLARHQDLTTAILSATVSLHGLVRRHLPYSPASPQYIFSYHDIHHVISGLHLLSARSRGGSRPKHGQRKIGGRRQSQVHHGISPQSSVAPPMMRTIIRLWCHEVTRTYTDRITSTSDMDWFTSSLEDTVQQYFCSGREMPPASPISILEESSSTSVNASTDAPITTESSRVQPEPPEIAKAITDSERSRVLSASSVSLPSIRSPSVPLDTGRSSRNTTPDPLPPISGKEQSLSSRPEGQGMSELKDGRSSREDRVRRGVSFKAGLVTDTDLLTGPLITSNQLKNPDEKLTDIVMAKFIPTGQAETDKGYSEFSLSHLHDGLKTVQASYNESVKTKMNLAFFKDSLCHIARITRTLATSGGNALLIAESPAVGRTSLVRLGAYLARCKLFTCSPGPSSSENQKRLRQVMKKASQLAGVNGRPVVLLVKTRMGELAMEDVCCFLKEGSCPGLYSETELTHIAGQMLGGSKPATRSKAESALQNYFNRVRTYLHVIVSMDCQDGSLSCSRGFLKRFPALLQRSQCVDVYRPWSQEVYIEVARHWVQASTTDTYTNKVIGPALESTEQSIVSKALAYIHQSAHQRLIFYHLADNHIYSPATFLDLIDLFKSLKWKIMKEEKIQSVKYKAGLDKVNEALQTINSYREELSSLQPQYQLAVDIADQKRVELQRYQQEYNDAKGHCTQDDTAITEMQKPLEAIKKKAQAELDRVNPVYEAALHALRSLDSSALDEIRTFRKPPATVIKVVNALCLLFGEPYGWECGKALINRDNFFLDLEFYDKSNMPEPIYHKLNVLFVQDKGFRPEAVAKSSHAARSLCMWIHAVFTYATIHRNMRPQIAVVEEAEGKLHEAQSHLGQKRVKAQEVQGILEQRIAEYQRCVEHVNSLDRAVKAIEGQIAEASSLMDNIETQHVLWRDALKQAQDHLSTSTGDALLVAASATYLGPMEQSMRVALQADWIEAFQKGQFHSGGGASPASESQMIPVRHNLSLRAILSSIEEQQTWERRDHPQDTHAAQSALYMRACMIAMKHHWPLVLDPDDRALSWIRLLQERGLDSFHEGPDPPGDSMRAESCVSDYEEKEGGIEESADSSTLCAESPRTVTCFGREESSLYTPTRDVTRLGDSIETIDVADRPPLDLMVAPSDDPTLPMKLHQAVVHGYTLVVMHFERQPLGEHFREVLKRNVKTGEKGECRIMIGHNECVYNNKFKLILCSALPLTLQGAGLSRLPLGDVILINMATDREGLEEVLLKDVLSSERPEYINQLRSIRGDVREQMITINQAEEDILKMTVGLSHGILDEANMSDKLLQFQQQILSTEATLEESLSLQRQLMERKRPFLLVAHHGTLLYSTIRRLERVDPAYHVPLWCFLRWFSRAIRARQKDPSNIAAPRARALELINNLTRDVSRWMSQWCSHSELFMFMLAAERMREGGELTREEWGVFVSGVGGVKTTDDDDDKKSRLYWMKAWLTCIHLESKLPSFRGLETCLLQHADQWKEYFEHQPVLLAPVPGEELTRLSVFQKAILWRIARPDKLASICCDVTVYQLGSGTSPGLPSVDDYLPLLAPERPLLILLPKGHCLFNPPSEVENLCSASKGLERNFHRLTLGTSGRMEEATRLLKYCQAEGHWLLLENCQNVQEWDEGFLRELQGLLGGSATEGTGRDRPHPDFRLFMVTENSHYFPGILLKHSLKISVSRPRSFKTCLQYHYNNAGSWLEREHVMIPAKTTKLVHEMVFNLAFFHAVLSHRQLYPGLGSKETYHWNENDLYSSLDYLVSRGNSGLKEFVGTYIYGGRTTNREDLQTVQALADEVLVQWSDVKLMPSSMGIEGLLASLLSCVGGNVRNEPAELRATLQLIIDSMKPTTDLTQLGMSDGATALDERHRSSLMLETLQDLELKPQPPILPSAAILIPQLASMLKSLSTLNPSKPLVTNRDLLNHLDIFIHSEIQSVSARASSILSDIKVLMGALSSDIHQSSGIESALQALSDGRSPPGWGDSYGGTGGATEHVSDLLERFNLLMSYRESRDRVTCYNMAAFVRPRMFLRAVLMEHARKEFTDVQDVIMDVQVLPNQASVSVQSPDVGVYISGLYPHNASWDTDRLVPTETSQHSHCSSSSKLPLVWVRPSHKLYRPAPVDRSAPTYDCPIYKGAKRRDYNEPVMYIPLPVKPPKTWAAQRQVWVKIGE